MKPMLRISLLALFIVCAANQVFAQCGMTITTIVTPVSCANATTGSIVANVTGGTSPYQYQLAEAGAGAWQSANNFPSLLAGTYPVSVKDATGCIKTIYVTVTQPAPLTVNYSAIQPTCSGSSNAAINVSITGGTSPYSYSWTKNGTAFSTAPSISGLTSGNYLLTVTDAHSCQASPIVSQETKALSITGFNEDVIANGTNTAATSVTTHEMDSGPGGNVFFANGYSNASGTTSAGGVPASGAFTSAQDASRNYQLASYSSNNALLLRASGDASYGGATSGTLTFATQNRSSYSTLYVIGTTGSGTGTANYTVNYSDATTSTGSLTFPDWFGTASPFSAMGSLSRVSRGTGNFDAAGTFNLYELPITITGGNQGKTVNSVTFSWSSASAARINLFAITGLTSTAYGIRINDGPASSVTPAVAVTSNTSANQFCSGQSVNFTATPTNGGTSPSYQWKLNGANVGSNSPSYTNASLNNSDQVSVVLTASGGVGCLSTPTATSSPVLMTLGPKPASVTNTATSTAICTGDAVTFTASPVNGGATPSYQWKLNGANVGGNTPTYSNSTLNNNDQVSVVMTSSIGCATGNPATSNVATIGVQALGAPAATITATTPIVTFTSSIAFGGTTPGYQWFKNGTAIGGATGPTYSNPSAGLGDVYSLRVTSSYGCRTAPAAMSNYITVTSGTLPVVLQSFTATPRNDKYVDLKWITSFEQSADHFTIQRAAAGSTNWQNIAQVACTNSATGHTYVYTDQPVDAQSYIYRIEQTDIDGSAIYSEIRLVSLVKSQTWTVTEVGSDWILRVPRSATYSLADLEGRIIETGKVTNIKTIHKPAIQGVYLLTVTEGQARTTKKLRS